MKIINYVVFMLVVSTAYGWVGKKNEITNPTSINEIAATSILDVNEIPETTLADYANRKRIDIDYDTGIGVGQSVKQFPVTVFIDYTNGTMNDIIDSLGVNNLKMLFTTSDGMTPLYADIEKWDTTDTTAVIHVSKPDWVIDSKTCIYCYYDNDHADNTTYVGVGGSSAAATVWDSNFKMVQHLSDSTTSRTSDATSNGNYGTKRGINEPIEAAGKIGKAQSYNGIDDYINGNNINIANSAFTVSIWIKANSFDNRITFTVGTNAVVRESLHERITSSTSILFGLFGDDISVDLSNISDRWTYIAETFNNSFARNFYQDGYLLKSGTAEDYFIGNSIWYMGIRANGGEAFNGLIDETRISNVARSAAWIKAEYYSGVDSLLIYP